MSTSLTPRYIARAANKSFALPDVCFKIRELMDDPASTIDDFANVISVDPSLASRLLKIANSALYSFQGEISTLSRAIAVIGTQAIYDLVMIDVSASAFAHFHADGLDLQRFWRQSVHCALACKMLAVHCRIKDVERLFVAGLLHQFGELLVFHADPQKALACQQYDADHLPWQLQQQQLGFTYAEVAGELLSLWQLPHKIVLPVRHQHQAHSIHINTEIKLLHIAARLALVACHPDWYSKERLIHPDIVTALKLADEALESSDQFAYEQSGAILELMQANFYTKGRQART